MKGVFLGCRSEVYLEPLLSSGRRYRENVKNFYRSIKNCLGRLVVNTNSREMSNSYIKDPMAQNMQTSN